MNVYQRGLEIVIESLEEPLVEGGIRLMMIFKDLMVFMDDYEAEHIWSNADALAVQNPDYTTKEQWVEALYFNTNLLLPDKSDGIQNKEEHVLKLMLIVTMLSRFEDLGYERKDIKSVMFLVEALDEGVRVRYYIEDIAHCKPLLSRFLGKENNLVTLQ